MKFRAFTLIEVIIAIVILGILSAGTFVSIKNLYLKVLKSKSISDLSSDSQNLADQLSLLLYERLPNSVIGYDGNTTFSSIYSLDKTYHVLEWIGTSIEPLKKREYSGLVDMDDSNETTLTIKSPDTLVENVEISLESKFSTTNFLLNNNLALAFSGSFDDGLVLNSNDFNSSFGWHGNSADLLYTITPTSSNENIVLSTKPAAIYEKYYFVDSGYTVARGEDINLNATCVQSLNQIVDANTLFIFFNYRPWKNETFCADSGSAGTKVGEVSILSSEVSGFEIGLLNGNLYFNLSMQRSIPRKSNENNITISKQKVVY